MKNKLDIILPIYHEEDNIAETIHRIEKNVKTDCQLILIYDEESDPTVKIVRKLKNKFGNIREIKNMFGNGIVSAMKTGFKKSKSEILVIMTADLSDNPKDVDKMVKKINEGYDLVSASRYTNGGKRSGGSVLKGFLSYLACKTLNMLTGIPTTDSTNAFKCFRKSLIDKIIIESIGGFELPLEITVKAHALKAKIAEIPTIWNERRKGKSKFKLLTLLPHYLRWYLFALKDRISTAIN